MCIPGTEPPSAFSSTCMDILIHLISTVPPACQVNQKASKVLGKPAIAGHTLICCGAEGDVCSSFTASRVIPPSACHTVPSGCQASRELHRHRRFRYAYNLAVLIYQCHLAPHFWLGSKLTGAASGADPRITSALTRGPAWQF